VAEHIAVISQTPALSLDRLSLATAAIQKQVTDDFGPIWNVTATVDCFPTLEAKPHDYLPVVIRENVGVTAVGVHLSDDAERVFALVTYREEDWTLTLSHEILEMLVDPFGVRFPLGPSPADDGSTVEYLAEVCDPCQGLDFSYPVNGVQVSDFVIPAFYDANGPGHYDFRRHIDQPRQLLPGGYFTWRDLVTRDWWLTSLEEDELANELLGPVLPPLDVHLRSAIDRRVNQTMKDQKTKRKRKQKAKKKTTPTSYSPRDSAKAQAEWWQRQIERVCTAPSTRDLYAP
jgi:hypothetical protein